MPLKDKDKLREYQREQMRQRRAKQASIIPSSPSSSTGHNLPRVSKSEVPPLPQGKQQRPASAPSSSSSSKFLQLEPGSYWYDHEDTEGLPCYKGPGRCCLPLEHKPPAKPVTSCIFPVDQCPFYKGGKG